MEKTQVELMKEQINCLPPKDVKYAEKFIDNRDFEALKDLVDSVVFMAERPSKPNSKYANLNIEALNELRGTVDEYYSILYPSIDEPDYDDYDCDLIDEESDI